MKLHKTYLVRRDEDGVSCKIAYDGSVYRILDAHQEIANHSQDGFEFGYDGSGPTQLALALLVEHAGREVALKHYINFRSDFIASRYGDRFTLDGNDIDEWLKAEGEK